MPKTRSRKVAAQSPGESSSQVSWTSRHGEKGPWNRVTPVAHHCRHQVSPPVRCPCWLLDSAAFPRVPHLFHASAGPVPAAPDAPVENRLGLLLSPPGRLCRVSAPILRHGCVKCYRFMLECCCGHADGFLQALLLFYLHCDVGAIGGSQQCHLLMTEGCDG